MKKILVTGAYGQVGSELKALAKAYPEFVLIFVDRDDLDITNEQAVQAFFADAQLDYCINCAAYTAVDKAEAEEAAAHAVNALGPKYIAQAAVKTDTMVIQISTDYVYHNHQNTPFVETDATNPQGVYAATKLQGDDYVLQANVKNLIIRTSWVYSFFGHNFVKTMLRLGKDRDRLTVIFDQIGTPTYAHDLAKAILDMIQKMETGEVEKQNVGGIYHYSNEGVTSWYDFATAIFKLEKIDCRVAPILTKDYPTAAKRPHFSLLDKGKIKQVFGVEIPHWEKSLAACLSRLKQESFEY